MVAASELISMMRHELIAAPDGGDQKVSPD
jgi:hypothetical protein